MKKNKQEWKKISHNNINVNLNYEVNIKGQVRNVKSKKMLNPHQQNYRIHKNSNEIHIGCINYLKWDLFKGEMTSDLYFRGWKRLSNLDSRVLPEIFINIDGDVYNARRDRFLLGSVTSEGYYRFNTRSKDGQLIEIRRCRAIALLFKDIPIKYKELTFNNLSIHHIDHNRLNDDIDNLQIITPSEHAILHNNLKTFCID